MKKLALLAAIAAAGSATLASAATDGKDRRVTIQNASSQAVYYLYAYPTGVTPWLEDMLGDEIIPPGTSKVANFDYGTMDCRFEIKTVMKDGTEHFHRDADVCELRTWRITDDGDSLE